MNGSGKDSSYYFGLLCDCFNDLLVMLAFVVKNKEVQVYMQRGIRNWSERNVAPKHDPRLFRSREISKTKKHPKRATDIYIIDLEF